MKPYEEYGYWVLPVVGAPERADAMERLAFVRHRRIHPIRDAESIDHYAIVELHGEDPIGGTQLRWGAVDEDDCGTAYFVFRRTKEAAAGDVVVVLHQHLLTVRYYEPDGNGQVCLRSVEPTCPTWLLSADDVNIQGVVVERAIDLHDSGWA